MASLERLRVLWSGFKGAPGVSTFYFTDAVAMQGPLHAFLATLLDNMPPAVTLKIESSGDIISDVDGSLLGAWVGDNLPPSSGTVNGTFAGGAGFAVNWETGAIVGGSHVRGRTFFVPCASAALQGDGTVSDVLVNAIPGFVDTMLAGHAANMQIWQRPRLAAPAYSDRSGRVHPAITARNGGSAGVVSGSCPDLAVVLRSRRD